jgi:hypothetical protein
VHTPLARDESLRGLPTAVVTLTPHGIARAGGGLQRALGAWSKVAGRARHALRRSARSPVVDALDALALGFLGGDGKQPQLQMFISDAFQVRRVEGKKRPHIYGASPKSLLK